MDGERLAGLRPPDPLTWRISCRDLELWLEDHFVDDDNNNKDSSNPDALPYLHFPRQDAGWLGCRRTPPHLGYKSLLGILEELPDNNASDCMLTVQCYQSLDRDETLGRNPQQPLTDHPTWERASADTAAADATVHNPADSFVLDRVDWIDLRLSSTSKNTNGNAAALTPRAVALVRSLLGSHHAASPWSVRIIANNNDDSDAQSQQLKTNSTPESRHPRTVILQMNNNDPLVEALVDLRVGDVCPSWYLAGTGHIQGTPPGISVDSTTPSESVILVYRVLPPRDHLALFHPLTKQPAAPGCLWETVVVPPKEDDDIDGEEPPPPQLEYRLVSPPYVAASEYGSLLDPLLQPDVLDQLEQDARTIAHWTAWPESQHYQTKKNHSSANSSSNGDSDGSAPWTVFPLCYCFPATDLAARTWIPQTCGLVPRTVQHLQACLGDTLRTALFSRLDPGALLEAHTGWEDLANHVLRLHIPLIVPPQQHHDDNTTATTTASDDTLCGTWVDGCVQLHRRGVPLLFDDSKTHRAMNVSPTHDRIVLILDLERPAGLPRGTATGGHSDELDQFIQKMGVA